MNLTRKNWKGWTPNNDDNGDPSGLLRADNLVLDQDGSIRLARGTARKSSGAFGSTSADTPNALYSRTLAAGTVGVSGSFVNLRYVSYNGTVARNYAGGSPSEMDFSGAILTGGAADYAAFGNAWGHTFVFSNTKKRADKGASSSWRDLGIAAQTAPSVVVKDPPENIATSTWALGTTSGTFPSANTEWEIKEGNEGGTDAFDTTYAQVTVDSGTLRGIAQAPKTSVTGETWDSTIFGGTSRRETPNDLFNIEVRFENPDKLKKFRVELYMDDIAGTTAPDVRNYFWHEWLPNEATENLLDYYDPDGYGYSDSSTFINDAQNDLTPGLSFSSLFPESGNFWATLQCRRSKFKRVGTDDSLDWHTIKGIRVITVYTELDDEGNPFDFYFGAIKFQGGTIGPLNGYYSYIEVDINDTGEYVEMGIASPASSEVQVLNSYTEVTCHALAGNANKKWIFRSSTQTPGYYFIKELTANFTTAFEDRMSDLDALRNVSLEYYRTALPDGIRYVVGPYYDRMLYFDYRSLYPSYRYDPGSYDSRHVMDIAAADNEVILWVQKVIDGEILVGTTNDIYALRGNFNYDEATGLLDVSVQALGIEQVPISTACTVYGTTVIYQAEDGWRTVEGSSTRVISGQLDRIYKKEDRWGVYAVVKGSRNSSTSAAVVSGSCLICSVDHNTTGRALHIYDFERGYWRLWRDTVNTGDNPLTLIAEEDGTVLFSTTSSGDRYLYEWDTGTAIGNARKQSFTFRTVYDSDGKPNNRKDLLVLRMLLDTGNEGVTVHIWGYDHTNTWTERTYSVATNGLLEHFLELSAYPIAPKRVAVQIVPTTTIAAFRLVEFSFEYQERPEQVKFLRLPPDNLGVAGRKRLPALNFVIDTLGSPVTFTPILDGVAQTQSNVTTSDKTVAIHTFTSDKTATNVEGTLYSAVSPFEFYGLLPQRDIEVLPDPVKYRFINATNFNTTKRKRFLQFAITIDTGGSNVTYTPIVDGVSLTPQTVNTSRKQTVIYYLIGSVVGVEVSGTLSGTNTFEFYGYAFEECIFEALPAAGKYIHIPYTNFGTTSRKRFIQLGLIIDTKGQAVTYTPYVDGVAKLPLQITTSFKQTILYTFTEDTTGTDVGGILSGASEFEFYGVSNDDSVWEKLPAAAKFIKLQTTNFGNASKKRVRTLPFVMDTKGAIVTFTPEVDGVVQLPSYFTSSGKRTVLHYFNSDVFGIDYGGTLSCPTEFEFYQQIAPTLVEILPVGKLWDQFGPLHFLRKGKVRQLNVRLLPTGNSINYIIYTNDDVIHQGVKTVTPNKEQAIEIKLPRGVNVELFRCELTSDSVFHRMSAEVKVDITGNQTDWKWMRI